MKFNPDPNKQAHEVHFSNRTNKDSSLFIKFNNNKVKTISLQKHLGLILDEQLNKESFISKLERVQYKACLAITGVIQGTSSECLNKELDLESLNDRRWVCKLTFFYKIVIVSELSTVSFRLLERK